MRASMRGLEQILREHPLFGDLEPRFIELMCGCARNVRFDPEQYLFHESEPADTFYLLRHGRVALQIAAPERGALTFQTLGPGEIVGLSWLIPPYRWRFDALARETVRALAFDGVCLRAKLEADPQLGYAVLKRIVARLIERLHATRLQILDVYGTPG